MPEHQLSLEARVAALDSQVQSIVKNIDGLDRLFSSIKDSSDLEQRIAVLETEVEVIQAKLEKKIEKNEFWPIKTVVYGLAGTALLALLGAIIKGVIPLQVTGTH
jgi:tetrahydromethanopterin S-methyltransferase subunit B